MMDETWGDEGIDPGGMMILGTEQLQSSPDYSSYDESPSAAGSRDCTPDHTQDSAFDGVLHYIHELQENHNQLVERFENLRAGYQRDYSFIFEALEEEKSRWELLEERFIDVTDLRQNEILNLKEELATKAEKIADQPFDTTPDFHEVLEACETRLFKLEQQQQQEEEAMQPESWADAIQSLLGNLMNVPLAIIAILLVLMSTVTNCVVLFVKTSRRVLCTLLFLILLSFLWWHRDIILDTHHLYFCTQHPGTDK